MEIKMTAINTNTASLNAQYYLAKTNKEMESSMAKLSSGQKVNSAADDAAGLAIAGRMTSQIKGLNMAIKNANDTIALSQTAEGAMEEVTNMLQRMRELAVQASNGTMNDSDRASLDSEVQALKTEIDRVANTTQFNNQNLLDGSFSKSFQIGDKSGQTVDLDISSIATSSLGMGSTSVGSDTLIGGRASFAAMAEGDVKINGQDIGAIASGGDMEDVLKAINDNVDNVVATSFNTVVAKTIGDGETADSEFIIDVTELGAAKGTSFYISASNDLAELVSNINAETGGVVAASINDDGKLVLSNTTGATIKVTDDSASGNATFDGGSGFGGATQQTFNGFIQLTSTDGSSVQVERGNKALTAPGSAADLQSLGFRETTRLTDEDAYTITGITLTDNTASFNKTDLTINGVEIYDEDISTDSIQGRLDAINNFSDETGVVASAYFEKIIDMTDSHAGTDTSDFASSDLVFINGVSASYGASLSALVTNINTDTTSHGITAEAKGNNLILTGANVAAVTIEVQASAGGGSATNSTIETNLEAGDGMARLRLDSINNSPISIELGDSSSVATHGFLETNVGAADYQVNSPTVSSSGSGSINGVTIASLSEATSALANIDNAIEAVSSLRSDLGALQNRLDHTINNLSSVSNATEGARSRIMDTDFATETANLTKQQILSQAATSMLAQANQSKQGILALLQG
jgi:flagellin